MESICAKFGGYRSKIKQIKPRDIFTYKTYVKTVINCTVAPPCVKFHVQILPAVASNWPFSITLRAPV